jgi:hypothetical protein
MVATKLQNFGAMIPAVDDRLLPQNNAALSQNCWVYKGSLEAFPNMTPVHTLSSTNIGAFRIPIQNYGKDNIPDSYWLEFQTKNFDVISSPVVGDSYERFYWAGDTFSPMYNTKARIAASQSEYILGIPSPSVAPSVVVTGGTGPTETRAYVYTWVSTYGEEGPPSEPVLQTGNSDGTWDVTLTAPTVGDTTSRSLDYVRIYRTITGTSGSTTYYLVVEQAIGTTTYADSIGTTTVAGNSILESTFYTAPPNDIQGITAMPNGIVAGFRENEVWFSEPYKPHAWPTQYTVAVDGEIVGLGVMGQTLVVCTRISPYTISGVNPASMAVSNISTVEPCLSRGSIVSTPRGVVYASQNGLIAVTPGQTNNVTNNLMTKDIWLDVQNYIDPQKIQAATLGDAYYCWGSLGTGCFEDTCFENTAFVLDDFTGAYLGAAIDINDPRIGYMKLTDTTATENCWRDEWTGEILVVRGGDVYWLDLDPDRSRGTYLWKSKVLETPNKRNFAAMRIYFETYSDSPELNPTPNADLVQTLAADQYGLARVYADGVLKFTRELRTSGEMMRLPSGFKGTFWQVEIEARVKVNSIEIATTALELGSV